MYDDAWPHSPSLLGFGVANVTPVRLHEPVSVTTLIALMTQPADDRDIVVTTVRDGMPDDYPTTSRLRINQMVLVLRSGATIVVDGVYRVMETQWLDAVGVRVTGHITAVTSGAIVEDPAPRRRPHEFIGYFELTPETPTPRATRVTLQRLNARSDSKQPDYWQAMGFVAGAVHPLHPLGGLPKVDIDTLLGAVNLSTLPSPQRPRTNRIFTTDAAFHVPATEHCSVEVRFLDMGSVDATAHPLALGGYWFTGEIVGVQFGSEHPYRVSQLDMPISVRGFFEVSTPLAPPVIWFQIQGPRSTSVANGDIIEKPLAPQLQ